MVLIPRGAVHENLAELAVEFRRLNNAFGPFVEIVLGTREPLQVRAIASSQFGLYLLAVPPVAAFIATAIERIIQTYVGILDIRIKHRELQEGPTNVPAEVLAPLAAFAEGRMEEAIRQYVDEAVTERLQASRGGREHELRNELQSSMNAIANRIDDGYSFDVRVNDTEGDSEEEPTDEETAAAIQTIIASGPSLKFMNLEGRGILSLPEASDEAPPGDDQQ